MPQATFRIWRGDQKGGEFKDYTAEVGEGMVVLDAVHQIQATQAPDLACRWNCKAGKCGSCSAEVNGSPKLMCMTRLNELPLDEPVTVEPMRILEVTQPVARVERMHLERGGIHEVPRPDESGLLMFAVVADLRKAHGIGYCNITKCCTNVCPEHITITDNAIIPLKERVVDEFYDPLGRLLKVFSRRDAP